jgi:hypothetical protein
MRNRVDAVVLGLLVLGIAALLVAWPQPDRVTQENFDRISDGMGRAEVEAILGPPGDYTTGPSQCLPAFKQLGLPPVVLDWFADTAWVSIGFDDSGGVVLKRYYPLKRAEQGPLDSLLWRAKRQWRRWTNPN